MKNQSLEKRDGSVVQSTCCSYKHPRSVSSNHIGVAYNSLEKQPQGDLILSSGLSRYRVEYTCIHINQNQNSYHLKKENKTLKENLEHQSVETSWTDLCFLLLWWTLPLCFLCLVLLFAFSLLFFLLPLFCLPPPPLPLSFWNSLSEYPRLTWNSQSICFHLPHAELTGRPAGMHV